AVRLQLRERVKQIAEGVAGAFGAQAEVRFVEGYPVTVNHPDQTAFAQRVAEDVAGAPQVNGAAPPLMAAEDFAYMLEARPGAYIFVGNGPSAGLHHPAYDFADAAIPFGASYWVRLVETALQPA
ncbi:MAG TPA: M20/M25/M40 family metallo-hydrolase, partial [Xanthobacteraceae bacterium]|nr:M20/M25/M40 family metallo-hydrolase [Xanthobacteraceae bacterium]